MGKASAPAAPDYTPLIQQELAMTNRQFNLEWPYAKQYLQSATQMGKQQASLYTGTALPMTQQFANTAQNYNSPAQANVNAGAAMADVGASFDASRTAAEQQLQSYGIDPSQTRFGALDLSTRVGQAAATAAAGTQSRLNTQATGLGLQGQAINMMSGFPSQINMENTGATSNANSVGSAVSSGLGSTANMMNLGYQNQFQGAAFNAAQSNAMFSGLGSLVGGGIGLAMLGGWQPFGGGGGAIGPGGLY